jgi:hypothetical protein
LTGSKTVVLLPLPPHPVKANARPRANAAAAALTTRRIVAGVPPAGQPPAEAGSRLTVSFVSRGERSARRRGGSYALGGRRLSGHGGPGGPRRQRGSSSLDGVPGIPDE